MSHQVKHLNSPGQDGKVGKRIMNNLNTLNWVVIKSNTTISKSLSKKLNKIRFGGTQKNTFSFYYTKKQDLEKILSLLKSFKRQKFEVVEFTDKQFGLSINSFNPTSQSFENQVSKLPLSNKFFWFEGSYKQTVTPITKRQFDNIIKINH